MKSGLEFNRLEFNRLPRDAQREIEEWCASEWAFNRRHQQAIGDELGVYSASWVCLCIGKFLVRLRPDLAETSRCRTIVPIVSGVERQQIIKELLGHPRPLPRHLLTTRRGEVRKQKLNRPRDMGGPRDCWLTFVPGPDPRRDYPVADQLR